MTLSVTVTLFCDGEDCPAWVDDVSGLRRSEAAAAAWLAAKLKGWERRDGRDLCPKCPPGWVEGWVTSVAGQRLIYVGCSPEGDVNS